MPLQWEEKATRESWMCQGFKAKGGSHAPGHSSARSFCIHAQRLQTANLTSPFPSVHLDIYRRVHLLHFH